MSGEIPLGSKLPTTAEFIERYRISNVTVQRALVILKSEGLAIGRTGAGVYVTSPTLDHINDPRHHVSTLTEMGSAPPPLRVAEVLGIDSGVAVWREERITSVDNWPLRLITSYRRGKAAAAGAESTDRVMVRMPTTAELIALNLPDEVPVMCTFRVVHDESGGLVEVQLVVEPGHLCQRLYAAPNPR
ncbi:GntR family transcriptional regulator [Streptomyces sp. NPDC001667]